MNFNIRKFAALFIAVALCFSSCKNEEEDPLKNPAEEKLLLKVTVPSTSITNDEFSTNGGWIFLSDSKGKTLAVRKIENGAVLEFERPETFKEDKFFLNIVRAGKYTNGENRHNNYQISTYSVDTATEVNLPSSTTPSQVLGSATMTVKNAPGLTLDYNHPFISIEGQQGSISSYSSWEGTLKFEFNLFKAPVRGLLSVKTDEDLPHKYKFFDKLERGVDYEADLGELVSMENSVEFELPPAVYHYSILEGFTVAGDKSTQYNLGFSDNKMVKLYYPKDVFKEFSTFSYYNTGNSSHFYHKIGSPMTSFEPLSVSMNLITKSVDNYEFTNTGLYDFYTVSFNGFKEIEKEYHNFNWFVYGVSSNSVKGMLPEIPMEIIDEYPMMNRSSLNMSSVGFYEYPEMDGEQYFEGLLKDAFQESKGYKGTSFTIESSGQRTVISKEAAKKQFEEFIKASTY